MNEDSFSADDKLGGIALIEIEGIARDSLQTIIQWTRICSLAGFAGLGLNLLSTILSYTRQNAFGEYGAAITVISGIISLVFSLYINSYLYQFSRNMKSSLDDEDQERFRAASSFLRKYFRMVLIMFIVTIVFAFLTAGMMSSQFLRF